jgi:hypothetical protein
MSRLFIVVAICLTATVGCSQESPDANAAADQRTAQQETSIEATTPVGEIVMDDPIAFDVYTDFI